jgi:large subunit ribosomal protein L29
MKADEIRQKNDGELRSQLRENDDQMFRLRLRLKMGQTEGLKKYLTLRREKARILTVLRERETSARQEQ